VHETVHKDNSRRDEFMTLGILKQTSLGGIGTSNVFGGVRLQFYRPKATVTDLSEPWDLSCTVSVIFMFSNTH